jgi:hypothetical protein
VKQEMLTSSGELIVLGNDKKEENDSYTQMLSSDARVSKFISVIFYPLLDGIQFGLCPCDVQNSVLGNDNF